MDRKCFVLRHASSTAVSENVESAVEAMVNFSSPSSSIGKPVCSFCASQVGPLWKVSMVESDDFDQLARRERMRRQTESSKYVTSRLMLLDS